MIKPLTSLRFFFALMVFTSHLAFVKTNWAWYEWLQRNIFFEGYLGVSFFFILSGFVLAHSYQSKIITQAITKKQFYLARWARIYPLHIFTLVASIGLLGIPIDGWKLLAQLFLIQSFIPSLDFAYSYNSPAWSISDEAFFYLMFPLIIYGVNRFKWVRYLFLIVPIGITIGIYFSHSEAHKVIFYIHPIVRLADFILGIFLYQFIQMGKTKHWFDSFTKASLFEMGALLVFLVFLAGHNFIDRGYRFSVYYWLPMALILWSFSYQSGVISKTISHRWFVLLGEISFGFYMIHFIMIQVFIRLRIIFYWPLSDIELSILIFTTSLLVSYWSYKYIELPINKRMKTYLMRP